MFNLNKLPQAILSRIKGLSWSCDNVGQSGSTILLFKDIVLKIEKIGRSSENDKKLLYWLNGKLPVPKIIETVIQDGYSFLLMTRLSGDMACSDNCLQDMEATVKALANGLKMLWQIDIFNCPCSNNISDKMIQAKYNIENDLVNMNDFEPETFSPGSFKDLSDLYNYIDQNRPKEDFVFSHGDYCLPNIFVSGCDVTGFLDWGNGGVADRWQDIALCVCSLRHNYVEYAGYSEGDFLKCKSLLFQELGIEPDEDKIRYYILLDELF